MKRFLFFCLLSISLAVTAADLTVTNTAPEGGDRSPHFELKQTKSLHELDSTIIGRGTNFIQSSIVGVLTTVTNVLNLGTLTNILCTIEVWNKTNLVVTISTNGLGSAADTPLFVRHLDGTNEVKQLGAWTVGLGDQSTNAIGVISLELTNTVTSLYNLSNVVNTLILTNTASLNEISNKLAGTLSATVTIGDQRTNIIGITSLELTNTATGLFNLSNLVDNLILTNTTSLNEISNKLAGTLTASVTDIGDQSTNTIGVISLELTNAVTSLYNLSNVVNNLILTNAASLNEISNKLAGTLTASAAIGDQSTNTIGVISLELTNAVTSLYNLSNVVNNLILTNTMSLNEISNKLAGTLTASATIGDQSTNTIGVQSSELTNIVLLLNNQSNQMTSLQASNNLISARVDAVTAQIAGGIGFTNSTAGMTNNAGDYLEVVPRAGTNNIGGTLPAFAAIPTVSPTESTNKTYGWPLYSVAAQFAITTGVTTNGAALAAAQTVIADTDTDIPFLLSATYVLNTNCYSYSPQIIAYVFKAAPTANGANGAIAFTYADWTNCVGTLAFTNRWFNAGTNAAQTITANFAVAPTNYIVPVVENIAYTNLAGSDTIVFSFQQGK